jgi:hypothetical protein
MKKAVWLNILKWVWLAVVIAAAGWFFSVNFRDIRTYITNISITRLILSLLLLIVAKFLTADLTYYSLTLTGQTVSFKEAFSITSITQLGKYLPGGIWHFAGKFGVYQARGMSAKQAARPIIIENLWLIASALMTGLAALLFSHSPLPCRYIPVFCNRTSGLILIFSSGMIWIFSTYLILRYLIKTTISPLLHFRLCLEQLLIWFLFGCSFWLVYPQNPSLDFLLQAIGAFALSWALGYVVFFAPGGIGIREASMTLLFSSFFLPQTTAIFAAVHRMLWVLTEIFLALLCMAVFGLPLGLDQPDKPSQNMDNK